MLQTQRTKGYGKRLFFILWAAGMAGVVSLLFVDIEAMIAAFPRPEGSPPPELPPPVLLKIATVIQPTIFVTIAVLVGLYLTPKVGLHTPAAEAAADRSPIWPDLRPQILPGIIAGILSGIFIAFSWAVARPSMPGGFAARAEEFNKFVPAGVRILSGGFTEEILLRWGMMTFLVWLFWLVFQRRSGSPAALCFVAAILLSSLLFGAGHLPIASVISGGLTVPMVAYVLTANSVFGIVAGFLYWRLGLESAIIAHVCTHIVLITAIYLAL